jgi:hypothetical protein
MRVLYIHVDSYCYNKRMLELESRPATMEIFGPLSNPWAIPLLNARYLRRDRFTLRCFSVPSSGKPKHEGMNSVRNSRRKRGAEGKPNPMGRVYRRPDNSSLALGKACTIIDCLDSLLLSPHTSQTPVYFEAFRQSLLAIRYDQMAWSVHSPFTEASRGPSRCN